MTVEISTGPSWQDLHGWHELFVAGRMQKPVALLGTPDPRVSAAAAANLRSALAAALLTLPEVWPGGYYPPRYPTHFEPSFLESSGTLSRGEQYPPGPALRRSRRGSYTRHCAGCRTTVIYGRGLHSSTFQLNLSRF